MTYNYMPVFTLGSVKGNSDVQYMYVIVLNLEKLLKKEILYMTMMLECNLELLVECFCLQMLEKECVNLCTTQESVE